MTLSVMLLTSSRSSTHVGRSTSNTPSNPMNASGKTIPRLSLSRCRKGCDAIAAIRLHSLLGFELAGQFVHIRNNFGDGGIKLFGDFLADVAEFVESAGQWLALENGNAVGDGDLANAGGEIAAALGDDLGSVHGGGVVLES